MRVMFIIRICVIPEMESAGEVKRAGILFFRTMLQELQECLCLLDSMDFVSLLLYEHKYHVDSILQDITLQEVEANVALVHDVLKGVILFSQREKDSLSDLEEWEKWKFVSLGVISSGQILTVELAGVRMQESAASKEHPRNPHPSSQVCMRINILKAHLLSFLMTPSDPKPYAPKLSVIPTSDPRDMTVEDLPVWGCVCW